MEVQIGKMITGDFEKNTMTIEVAGEMKLKAGSYAIVPIAKYKELVGKNQYKKGDKIKDIFGFETTVDDVDGEDVWFIDENGERLYNHHSVINRV
tara:strand:- start:584 stop:868 length:285 start_codon:yes stop_codon:yes gene_type:complete